MGKCHFVTILKVFFNLSTHKIVNCLRTADFYCVYGTHRSEFLMNTERKIVRTYAVRIVIYIVDTVRIVKIIIYITEIGYQISVSALCHPFYWFLRVMEITPCEPTSDLHL